MAFNKFLVVQQLVAAPKIVVFAAPVQKLAHTVEHMGGPHHVPARQGQQAVQVAPHIELGALFRRQSKHEVRTHQVHHRRGFQARRQQQLASRHFHQIIDRTLAHKNSLQRRQVACVTITQFNWLWNTPTSRNLSKNTQFM